MSNARITALAEALVSGDASAALESARRDEGVSEAVAREAARLLRQRAMAHANWALPADGVWPQAQGAFVTFAQECREADVEMAEALLDACVHERVRDGAFLLTVEAIEWLLAVIPGRVSAELDDPARGGSGLVYAIWQLPAEEGARWLLRMLPQRDSDVNSAYQYMRAGRTRETPEGPVTIMRTWDAGDWIARLDALSDARIDPRPGMLNVFGSKLNPPPRETARAQVRLGCTYATDPTDVLIIGLLRQLRHYRTGDPARDADLFWWDADGRQLPVLWEIVAALGYAEHWPALLAAAAAEGLIDRAAELRLTDEFARLRAPGEPVWEIEGVADAGTVRLPDGLLTGGDPWWACDEAAWVVALSPGAYAVRTVVANHPSLGRANAAAELLVTAAVPARWELIQPSDPTTRGYVSAVGVASFAPTAMLQSAPHEALPDDFTEPAAASEIAGDDDDSLVMFTVAPQHQECVTWQGFDQDGRLARLVTDLGLLELDPPSTGVPWVSLRSD